MRGALFGTETSGCPSGASACFCSRAFCVLPPPQGTGWKKGKFSPRTQKGIRGSQREISLPAVFLNQLDGLLAGHVLDGERHKAQSAGLPANGLLAMLRLSPGQYFSARSQMAACFSASSSKIRVRPKAMTLRK